MHTKQDLRVFSKWRISNSNCYPTILSANMIFRLFTLCLLATPFTSFHLISSAEDSKCEKQLEQIFGEWHFTEKRSLKPIIEVLEMNKDGTFARRIKTVNSTLTFVGIIEFKTDGTAIFAVTHKVQSNTKARLEKYRVFELRIGRDFAGNLMIQDETENSNSKPLTDVEIEQGVVGRIRRIDDVTSFKWPTTYFRKPYKNQDQIRFHEKMDTRKSKAGSKSHRGG